MHEPRQINRLLTLVCAAGCATWAQVSHAQTPPQGTTPSENDAASSEPAIHVQVQGASRPRTAAGLNLQPDVLSATGERSGSDLLRGVPGLFLTQHSGEGKAHQIFYRGFDAVHGQDLEVVVGGVPVNDVSNIHGQGYADLHFVIPEVVERLEVLPGPFSPTQGDFAVAGSVRYQLGYAREGLSAHAGAGSFGARRGLFLYHPKGTPSANFGAFEIYQTDGFGVSRAAQRGNAMLQSMYTLGEQTQLRVLASAHVGRFESAGVLRLRDIEQGRIERFGSYDSDQGGYASRVQLATELGTVLGDAELRFMPFAVLRNMGLRSNFTGSLVNDDSDDNNWQRHETQVLGFAAQVTQPLPLLHSQDQLSAGLFAQHDRADQSQVYTRSGRALADAHLGVTHAAGWLGMRLHPHRQVALDAALRADVFALAVQDRLATATRASQGSHLGPKLSADVGLLPGWHAFAAWGQGFRSPQARSVGDGERTPLTRVSAAEVGTRYGKGQSFSAALVGFGSWLDDDLVFNEATSRNERTPSTFRGGFSGDLTVRQGRLVSSCGGSNTRAVFTASDSRFRTGDLVPYVPRWVLRCDAALGVPWGQLGNRALGSSFGLAQQLVWQRPLPYSQVDPGFMTLDARAALHWAALELALDVSNLLGAAWYDGQFVYDSRFAADTTQIAERHVTVGAPRSWFLTLAVHSDVGSE